MFMKISLLSPVSSQNLLHVFQSKPQKFSIESPPALNMPTACARAFSFSLS